MLSRHYLIDLKVLGQKNAGFLSFDLVSFGIDFSGFFLICYSKRFDFTSDDNWTGVVAFSFLEILECQRLGEEWVRQCKSNI